jgi:aspartate/methionine/tyrosine aminotransferase
MVLPQRYLVSVKKIQDTVLICPPVISQYAAMGALEVGSRYCKEKLRGIAQVRELALDELAATRSFCEIPPADGAFYFLLKMDTPLDAMTVVERLIREHGVAVMPGTTFGMTEGCYLRVAYACLERDTVAEGMGRLVKGLTAIAEGRGR